MRPVDVARIIPVGSNNLHGTPVVFDYSAAHAKLNRQFEKDELTWEQFELLEWCLWLHKAANMAMAAFETAGFDEESAEEAAWYKLLCANEDTPQIIERLLAIKETK